MSFPKNQDFVLRLSKKLLGVIPKNFLNEVLKYLGLENPAVINFYNKIPEENVILGLVNQNQMCLFNQKRISFLFKTKQDFTN